MLPVFVWNASPEIFHIDAIDWGLRYYSLMFVITLFSGYYLYLYFCKKDNIVLANPDALFLYVFLGAFIGMRLGHVLFYDPEYYFSHPLEIVMFWKGGLASHGGIAGVIAATLFYCYRFKAPLGVIIDLLCISVMLVFFIRIGNFFNSEIIGKPADVPWAVVFEKVDSIPRHPAQLYEALAYAMVFITLIVMYRIFHVKPGSYKLFGTAVAISFSARLFLEQFKENQSQFEDGMFLNMGQLLSMPFIALGLYLVFIRKSAPLPDTGQSHVTVKNPNNLSEKQTTPGTKKQHKNRKKRRK